MLLLVISIRPIDQDMHAPQGLAAPEGPVGRSFPHLPAHWPAAFGSETGRPRESRGVAARRLRKCRVKPVSALGLESELAASAEL
jgi:hypothetical protein